MKMSSTRCFFCEMSTIRRIGRNGKRTRESYELTDANLKKYPCIREYAYFKFQFKKEIAASEKTCRKCLQRAQRLYNKNHKPEQRTIEEITVTKSKKFQKEWSEYEFEDEDVKNVNKCTQPEDEFDDEDAKNFDSCTQSEDQFDDEDVKNVDILPKLEDEIKDEDVKDIAILTPPPKKENIAKTPVYPVPGFKRLSNTASYCAVAGCSNKKTLHRVHIAIRRDILWKHSLYIPKGTRVCVDHLFGEVWRNCPSLFRSTHETFNTTQITDMLRLLQIDKYYMDLQRFKTVDDTVFQYYTGFTKEEFLALLQQTPLVKHNRRAVAAFLCKLQTGDCNKRLSYVLRMSPTKFEREVEMARLAIDKQYLHRLFGF